MNVMKSYLLLLLFVYSLDIHAGRLTQVNLSDYGQLDEESICLTLKKAIDDIEGKRLILPPIHIDVDDIVIKGKDNFSIEGDTAYAITCRNFLIQDCNNFEIDGLYIKGLAKKFATFDIIGDCCRFKIHDCLFDSEKGGDGHYTFYGIHIVTDTKKPDCGYHNSPRSFNVYKNVVRHTRYDGILAHAYCSNFVIEKNEIIGSECIGIEVEGRLGSTRSTTVHPCKQAVIRNNIMRDCGDWGILLMWTEQVKVYKNKCTNSLGAFLTIGSKNLSVKNNFFEGREKGFEISQEYYKVSNGINNHIVVTGNTIKAMARGDNRGVLDIRHARNVFVKNNRITAFYREHTAYVSIASCQRVTIKNNEFTYEDEPLTDILYRANAPSPETDKKVPELDLKDLSIQEITIRKE